MDSSRLDALLIFLQTRGVEIGLNILGAFAIWVIGRWVIRAVLRVATAALETRHLEPTLVCYARSTLLTALTIALLIAVLASAGVETTSFAAPIAAVGVAIGWRGPAALELRRRDLPAHPQPFKVGDAVEVGGVSGKVHRARPVHAATIVTDDGVADAHREQQGLQREHPEQDGRATRAASISSRRSRTASTSRTPAAACASASS